VRARIYLSCSARLAQLEVVINSRRIRMAKSKKVVSKKVVAPVEAPVESVPLAVPVSVTAVEAPALTQVPAPSKPVRGRQAKAEPAVEDAAVKWKRRLGRWQAKAAAAGVDAKALMSEMLAA
jgi:hypothetical protein